MPADELARIALNQVSQMFPQETDERKLREAAMVLCKIKYGEMCSLGSKIHRQAQEWDEAFSCLWSAQQKK